MAKLRKWCAYKTLERPYTRWSKSKKKSFVKARPGKSVIKYDLGDLKGGPKQFDYRLQLISKEVTNVRSNAIEAARIVCIRNLEKELGRQGFYMRILMVPHHTIRENRLAAGAGADRLSTGMKHSFGKTIGTAAKIEKGKVLIELYLPSSKEELGREQLSKASKKLPVRTTIQGVKQKAVALTKKQKAARKRQMRIEEKALKEQEEREEQAQREKEKAEEEDDKKEGEEEGSDAA